MVHCREFIINFKSFIDFMDDATNKFLLYNYSFPNLTKTNPLRNMLLTLLGKLQLLESVSFPFTLFDIPTSS